MAREKPYFVEGKVADVYPNGHVVFVKVQNGNVYNIHPYTPGIEFDKLQKGTRVLLEVTSVLTRVLSATILAGECDGSTRGS